ncbi:hypothetical protein D9M71_630690 [compost metagenome]
MPKSSTATARPRRFNPERVCIAWETSLIRMLSVSSSSRQAGGVPVSSRMWAMRVPSWPSANWRADRFTEIFGTRTFSRCQTLSWRQASRSSQSPTWAIRPSSSSTGTNSAGAISPRRGCCQRSSASAPVRRRPSPVNCGW